MLLLIQQYWDIFLIGLVQIKYLKLFIITTLILMTFISYLFGACCVKSFQIRSFFWFICSHIRTEYKDLPRKVSYSVWIWENTDQKKLRIWTLFTQWEHSNITNQTYYTDILSYHGKSFSKFMSRRATRRGEPFLKNLKKRPDFRKKASNCFCF